MKALNEIIRNSYYENYNQETKTYTHRRDVGLYAILVFVIQRIISLELNGYNVENIELFISSYVPNENSYNFLFEKKNVKIDFSNIPQKDKDFFENQITTCGWGLENFEKLNLQLTNQIIDKFFTPSKIVIDTYNNILQSNNINLESTTFIWARNTDKIETHLPDVENYLKVVEKIDKKTNEIILQTDDYRVIENFRNFGIEFKIIKEIPISGNLDGFHNEMRYTNEKLFYHLYNMTKKEHLIQMYCISLLCKDVDKAILYPGNPTTYIPILKGSFDNCYLFKNNSELF